MIPPDFLEQSRFLDKKSFMNDLWHGKKRGAIAYNAFVRQESQGYVYYPESESIGERALEAFFNYYANRCWGYDYAIPVIQPVNKFSAGGSVLATAFGSRYNVEYGHTAPVIKSADEIKNLNLEPTLEDGYIPKALEVIRYIVEKTEGKIPIQMYNSGGPMDIASVVLHDSELLTALYTHPNQVHRLLQACTNLYIEFFQEQKKMVPEWSPIIAEDMYIPANYGILCGEDWLATISEDMAEEFEIPYINQISEAFNGVAIHSCGSFSHQFDLMKYKVKNLRGLYFNAGTTSFEKAVEKFRGTDVVLIPRWDVNKPFHFESRMDFVKRLLSYKTTDVSVYLIATDPEDPTVPREEDLFKASMEIVDYIENFRVMHREKNK